MEKSIILKPKKDFKAESSREKSLFEALHQKIDSYENEKNILLTLSNEMVKVRQRGDLMNVINNGLRRLVNFTHNVVTIEDEARETYRVYLTDPNSISRKLSRYDEAISISYPVTDGIYNVASVSDKPVVFDMTLFDLDKAPLWFKLNYAAGAREVLVKVLPCKGTSRLSLVLFGNKVGCFDEASLNIIERISSQLSTATTNITANEEILNKEKEKSFLLEFSQDIAAVRSKEDLSSVIQKAVKKLSSVKGYVIRLINDDRATTCPYIFDDTLLPEDNLEIKRIITSKFKIRDGIQDKVLKGDEPILFSTDEELRRTSRPDYVNFWNNMGFRKMMGAALRSGDKDLGVLFLETDIINTPLLKGICAQISVAISNILINEQLITYKQMLEVENDHLKEQINTNYNFSDIIGSGPEMQKVYSLMSIVAKSNSTVLLLGETGTGKELIARGIHNTSPRKDKLMVKVNCAALPANLIESELFGHEKGSFTGAIERRTGKFELAHNSTIFLDEIGELPLDIQVKLLRVIQEREFERVGGKSTIKVNVRIIAATNRNLEEEVKAGRFRADLYYRLNVFPISLPSLRNRIEDITPLANFFLARHCKNTGIKVTGISNKVMQELKRYHWPGNVRELEHLLERSILLTNDSVIREVHIPKSIDKEDDVFTRQTLDDVERTHIIQTLKVCMGKIAGFGGAADVLGVPSTTLHSKMKRLNISKADYFSKSKTLEVPAIYKH